MPPLRPIVEPKSDRPRAADLRGLEHLAWLMDRAFGIPGTSIRVGLDAILGLLPVGGDFLTGLVQVGIVLFAIFHYRVPRAVAARMAVNVLLDVVIGAIPLVGDAFDVFFKANTKNIQLLSQVEEQRQQNLRASSRSSIAFLIAVAAVLLLLLGLVLVGFITVVHWLIQRPLV
jgi:hypothetical protein